MKEFNSFSVQLRVGPTVIQGAFTDTQETSNHMLLMNRVGMASHLFAKNFSETSVERDTLDISSVKWCDF